MFTRNMSAPEMEKKSHPAPFYIGQSVYIPAEKKYGIFIGFNDNQSYDNCWVLYEDPDGGYEQFAHELNDMGYVLMPDTETVSGTRIYYGPFRKPTFTGTLVEKYVLEHLKEMITEIKNLTKTEKKNNDESKRHTAEEKQS